MPNWIISFWTATPTHSSEQWAEVVFSQLREICLRESVLHLLGCPSQAQQLQQWPVSRALQGWKRPRPACSPQNLVGGRLAISVNASGLQTTWFWNFLFPMYTNQKTQRLKSMNYTSFPTCISFVVCFQLLRRRLRLHMFWLFGGRLGRGLFCRDFGLFACAPHFFEKISNFGTQQLLILSLRSLFS